MAIIVAEIGTDMSRFPSAKHLASWVGVCPGNRQSGGKRLSGMATKGDVWLRAILLNEQLGVWIEDKGEEKTSASRAKPFVAD